MSDAPSPDSGARGWEFLAAKNGLPNVRFRGRMVHSAMDPAREASRMAASPEVVKADGVVIFGAGLGYLARACLEADPQRPVLVLEPDRDFALEAHGQGMEAFGPLPSGASWQVRSVPEPAGLVGILQDLALRRPALVANPALKACFPEAWEACTRGMELFLNRNQVNSRTLQRFGDLWVRNFSRNRSQLGRARGVAELAGRFSGIPGMVLAGGPGLDALLPLIARVRDRMVLVAVDTSLRACLAHGADPDFVVTMDPQYWNARHLDWCGNSRARVVTESSIHPGTLRALQGDLYFCASYFPLARWYEEHMGQDYGKLGAGGSVATSAWDLLRLCGCSESWISGLDLSCPGSHTHFRGALFEERSHRQSTRLSTAEQDRFGYLYNDAACLCPAEGGGTVMSDRRMDIYVQWFETQASLYPDRIAYRTGKGFRPVKGMQPCAPEDILALPPCRDRIDRILSDLDSRSLSPALPDSGHTGVSRSRNDHQDADRALAGLLDHLESLASEALELVERLAEAVRTPGSPLIPGILERLDRLDKSLMENPDSRIPGFLMEGEVRDILDRPPENDGGIKASRDLYGAMCKVIARHKALFFPESAHRQFL